MSSGWSTGIIQASSLEEHEEVVRNLWNLEFRQIKPGVLTSRTTYLSTPQMVIYHEQWDRPLRLKGELCRGRVAFGLPHHSNPWQFRAGGKSIEKHAIPWISDAGELDVTTESCYSNVVMIFDAGFLKRIAAQLQHPIARNALANPFLSAFNISSEKAIALRGRVEGLLRNITMSSPGTVQGEGEESRLPEHLADALLNTLVMSDDDNPSMRRMETSAYRYRYVRSCIEYSRSRGYSVSVPELCSLTGRSRRFLEYAFQESLGSSPIAFFNLCRLQEAYRELVTASPKERTVTEVAFRWEFSDVGRFAASYCKLFGEKPSQTLRRPKKRMINIPILWD